MRNLSEGISWFSSQVGVQLYPILKNDSTVSYAMNALKRTWKIILENKRLILTAMNYSINCHHSYGLNLHDMKGLCSKIFHQESYALILPTGHRLAGKESVDISEFSDEEFIFFPRNAQPRLHDTWMTAFNHCNDTPNIVQEVSNEAASLALVTAGIGISIVPKSLAQRSPEQVVFKKLMGDVPTLEIHVVYPENTAHASRDNFLRIIRDNVIN